MSLKSSVKFGLSSARAHWRLQRALQGNCTVANAHCEGPSVGGTYYFTSELGLYRVSGAGVTRIFDQTLYGIAFFEDWVFFSMFIDEWSLVVRGDRRALLGDTEAFRFKEIYRLRTLSTNDRIHGIFCTEEVLWVANTGRNSLVKIDARTGKVIGELALFTDRFGRALTQNANHINSVASYGQVTVFVAYRAGQGSMIGLTDERQVVGFSYPRQGVHDIYLMGDDFLFCDTFGENTTTRGGALMNRHGTIDESYFSQPPGCIVRGVAGTSAEMLLGHSHKGARAQRFSGHGALLHIARGKVIEKTEVGPSQIYQIIRDDGQYVCPAPKEVTFGGVHDLFHARFGQPIYQGETVAV